MSETMYKQCWLHSLTEEGELMHAAWIPVKFAVKGCKVYFGKKTKVPERIWEVTSVSNPALPESYLLEHERDHLTQRQASDI